MNLTLPLLLGALLAPPAEADMHAEFTQLATRFLDEYPALSPVNATTLGDHRFDGELDDVSDEQREKRRLFCRSFLERLGQLNRSQLSRDNQVDFSLLKRHLDKELWELDRLQDWAWDPLIYTNLCGTSIYGLLAREFAPLEQRLQHVARRLEQFPRLCEQIRSTLVPARVPRIHAETAVSQNRGVLSLLDQLVRPQLGSLKAADRERLEQAMAAATEAIERHQTWLEEELVPTAAGDFRIGAQLYDEKLAHVLQTPITRAELRDLAERELQRTREEMYEIAQTVYRAKFPYTEFPESPSPAYRQAIIRAALEQANARVPERDQIVAAAKQALEQATAFVRAKDFCTLPNEPLDIVLMPEFQRGVSVAYCDSPGPLDMNQKTFYAVAPLPEDWTAEQANSYLREYNHYAIHELTIHEAMPGHFVQIAHANRSASRLRAVLSSGTFVEGWACYAEQTMSREGYLDGDPLMRLIALKWYLRTIGNALLDQSIHVDGMRRADAMQLMIEQTFQEEREAAGKWTRAQLTSVQLATYFVGLQEHWELRRAAEAAWGKDFTLKRYHDGVMSFGSPPVKYVRALLLGTDVPE